MPEGLPILYRNRKIYCLILVCTILFVLVVPVFAENETATGGEPGSTDLAADNR